MWWGGNAHVLVYRLPYLKNKNMTVTSNDTVAIGKVKAVILFPGETCRILPSSHNRNDSFNQSFTFYKLHCKTADGIFFNEGRVNTGKFRKIVLNILLLSVSFQSERKNFN